MEGMSSIILAVLLALAVVPLAFILYVVVGGSYRAMQYFLRPRKANGKKKNRSSLCLVDADCPPGYICVNGRCVAQRS